jgi:hypothetical protein
VSDRLDGRFAPFSVIARVALLALVAACQPLDPIPPPPDGGTPCSRAVAVASDTVVISAGACNPWCIHVAAGTPIYFLNHDPDLYYFVADPPLPYDVPVPGSAPAVTLPLTTVGTLTFTAVHAPAATVTVFVE